MLLARIVTKDGYQLSAALARVLTALAGQAAAAGLEYIREQMP